jgi:hypothetical protein
VSVPVDGRSIPRASLPNIEAMASLPRPLIALLVATLGAFGMWYVELRPSSSKSGGSPSGVGQYQGAINQAHKAVAISGAANAKLGSPTSTARTATAPVHASTVTAHAAGKPVSAAKAQASTTTKAQTPAKTKALAPAKSRASASAKSKAAADSKSKSKAAAKTATNTSTMSAPTVATVQTALKDDKVVAILFYNGSAADDLAVKQELGTVSTDGGKVVKVAVPLSQLTNFALVTQQVPVVTAPTFVVIDAAKQATSITGFADTLAIQQLVAAAVAAKS